MLFVYFENDRICTLQLENSGRAARSPRAVVLKSWVYFSASVASGFEETAHLGLAGLPSTLKKVVGGVIEV
ncbi:hypothetical protein RB195_001797 [Necator americanus]|uniref:Uncharacterized protein n=1 Tax=Necator americanus TaxID=51031 RepID=A0ABR1DFY9_NECAM